MIYPLYGNADGLTDSEQRPLRPIGYSVREIAARTGRLLVRLRSTPGVSLRAGVRIAPAAQPIGLAVITDGQVLLVESVAWPGGIYSTTPDGRVHCDGIYIGQSVRPLIGAVRRLWRTLPGLHRVAAVVVVHPYGCGPAALPETTHPALAWLRPANAAAYIGDRLCGPNRWLRAAPAATCASAAWPSGDAGRPSQNNAG